MSVVKETVDRLLKGYDIRLRPDFGGNFLRIITPVPEFQPCEPVRQREVYFWNNQHVDAASKKSKVQLVADFDGTCLGLNRARYVKTIRAPTQLGNTTDVNLFLFQCKGNIVKIRLANSRRARQVEFNTVKCPFLFIPTFHVKRLRWSHGQMIAFTHTFFLLGIQSRLEWILSTIIRLTTAASAKPFLIYPQMWPDSP